MSTIMLTARCSRLLTSFLSLNLQAERHALEGCVLEMSGKAAALGKWLEENEKKQVSGEFLGWCSHFLRRIQLFLQCCQGAE